MTPSASLVSKDAVRIVVWFSKYHHILALLAGVLRIVHPEQFDLGYQALYKLRVSPNDVKDIEYVSLILEAWALPFTGAAILVNRETHSHRDLDAPQQGFDLCATLGTYTLGEFRLPDLQTTLFYPPGTTVLLLARTLKHEVPHVDGERAAIVLFNKDSVLEGIKLDTAPWPASLR
ncbi:hypothetical protein BDN72DRAFT_780128 [Pluteus cervinus]|uniref:Uncharacterized protein n=1 Tax=Pluteus cervinus TaxID=181527 RepID=A0ACD3A1Y6_9AGAR|nr:hypothetical protein BDN72DRAFT_780128 [Pluteus cervinus]